MSERILRIVRGEATEVYRLKLLQDGAASLQRLENGFFGAARLFRGGGESDGFDAGEPNTAAKMVRAIRYVSQFLNGTVNIGERDLLSPTSALTRNVRWFPGDIQMLRTSIVYVRELFPSAQFHVTQLLRRIFGDVCFLAMVALSSVLWLRTDAPVGSVGLALGLQIVSMMAILGFDRYWQPLRLRLRTLGEIRWSERGWRLVYLAPAALLSQLFFGTATVVVETLIGLANLIIHPVKIWESWRRLARGGSLEWKASSVSIGQDVRGWPLEEFRGAYRPAVQVGVGTSVFALWLVFLGVPIGILGLSGVGIFVASFLTVVLYAWCAGLPYTSEGAPQYRLPRREVLALSFTGLLGCALSGVLFGTGLYPLPAFEGSVGIVMLFLTGSALLALLFPIGYLAKQRARAPRDKRGAGRRWTSRAWLAGLAVATCLTTFFVTCPSARSVTRSKLVRAFRLGEDRWRMPEPERRIWEEVETAVRRHGRVDPAPLLRSEGDQVTLGRRAAIRMPDLPDLRGIPAPRLPLLSSLSSVDLHELYPLPLRDRTIIFKPERHFVAPARETTADASTPVEAGRRATELAQRRAAAVTPRRLSREELLVQERFIEAATYPWIARDELRRLGQRDDSGESIPLVEMARAYRWDDVKDLWDAVDVAQRGGAPDRVRLQRLRDGIEGVIAIGKTPVVSEVEGYLEEQLALIEDWSRKYPHLPLSAMRESPFTTPSRFSQVTRFLRQNKVSRDALARAWRLDYVDAYWDAAPTGQAIHQALQERPRSWAWEKFELDWDGNETLRRRWDDLEVEQALATRMWRAGPGHAEPTVQQLRQIIEFLERVLDRMLSGDARGPYSELARLFRLEGVDPQALQGKDPVAVLWASRSWTEAMAGRVATIVSRAATGEELPGTAEDRALIRDTARIRYPDDAGDPALRRMFEWLVLVDGAETYRELAAGYDRFARELADRGIALQGLARAPVLSEAQLYRDLLDVWHELPGRFADIPVRDDMVAEFLCHTAYFSTRDGREARTPRQFIEDFAGRLSEVNAQMHAAPPAAVQALADQHIERTLGRVSRSPQGRRFFAWWMVATEADVVQNNFGQHGINKVAKVATPVELATAWAGILESGMREWPRMPWSSPGFSAFFVNTAALEGWTVDELWRGFRAQLSDADRLMARHVVPAKTFEALVDRRVQEKSGSFNFDPTLGRANAVMALARLLEVVRLNGVDGFAGNPGLLSERMSLLYERLVREYPHLYWDGEGTLEFYLLAGCRQRWDLDQTVSHFNAEWSLANTLAAKGLLARLQAVARKEERELPPADHKIREFIDVQARRIQERTGLQIPNPRSRAMTALLALSRLVLGAGEEGQIPDQRGEPWSQTRVRAWAGALSPGQLSVGTTTWAESLISDWDDLLSAMRQEGPHFPWHRGSIVETNLLVMGNAGITLPVMREGRRRAWKAASDLVERRITLPAAFEGMVLEESKEDLRRKIAAARGALPKDVTDAEVTPDDPSLNPLNATLILADVVAEARLAYGEEPDAIALAQQIVEARAFGPQRYRFIPWLAKGFSPSFVLAAYRPDFRNQIWKYAELVDLPSVNALLGELSRRQSGSGWAAALPADVATDVREMMRQQTGHTPSSEQVVAFQAVRDGVFLLKEFLPQVPLSLDNVLALARLRAAVRALSADYPELHIIRAEDQSVRVGFAERLAVLAMKQGLEAGRDPHEATFVARCLDLVKNRYLKSMKEIYAPLRATLTPEELDFFQETIRAEARIDNQRRAAKYGLSSEALSVPDVKEDDLVADLALYEILYASEIGQGQDYLTDLFSIFGKIRSRPETTRVYRESLAYIDEKYAIERKLAGDPGYDAWRSSPAHDSWWKERGDFIKSDRGQIIALARTLTLVKQKAFSRDADPSAKASFARFGSFDDYLRSFFDAYEDVPRVPELATVLDRLRGEDPFLADGVRFALALFRYHVIGGLYPEIDEAERVFRGIASLLPSVAGDYQRVLGFSPRLESGVPLYDARVSFLRQDTEGGAGSGVYRRLNIVQRGVQRWTEAYFLKHAYKLLFFRELDAEDPTPTPRLPSSRLLVRALQGALDRVIPHTRGEETTAFLEQRLPDLLQAQTGSRDPSVWISWLMQHGEIGLDGRPTGRNPYAEEIAGYEERLSRYRTRIEEGRKAGGNVRAEEQRIRDIEREYDSLQRQIAWLLDAARGSAPLTALSRRDYREAVWLHGVLPLLLIVAIGAALRLLWGKATAGRALKRGGLGVSLLALAVMLVVGVPAAVALRPARAASLAPRALTWARLLERDPHNPERGRPAEGHDRPEGNTDQAEGQERRPQVRPRGAAAQIARVWGPLFATPSSEIAHGS